MTKTEFLKTLDSVSVNQVREILQKDYNHKLKATVRAQVLDEAWGVYSKEATPSPAGDSESAPSTTPAGEGLRYEGRLRASHHAFLKCGIQFDRKWTRLRELSDIEVATLRRYPQFCELRLMKE